MRDVRVREATDADVSELTRLRWALRDEAGASEPGIGRQLLEACLGRAREQGLDTLSGVAHGAERDASDPFPAGPGAVIMRA